MTTERGKGKGGQRVRFRARFTGAVVRVAAEGDAVLRHPTDRLDEIGDEAGDQALQDAGVAAQDELVYHPRLVELLHNYEGNAKYVGGCLDNELVVDKLLMTDPSGAGAVQRRETKDGT